MADFKLLNSVVVHEYQNKQMKYPPKNKKMK